MLICALSLLLLPTNWIVDAAAGPGTNFVDLPPAIAAAADGDTIFVRAGSYTGFVLSGKALTIRGDGVGVTIVGDVNPTQGCTVDGTPSGSVTVLSGLQFHGTQDGLDVQNGGHVVLLNCRLEGGAKFVLGRPALYVVAGEVEAVGCTLVGGDCTGSYPAFPGALGGAAASVQSGRFAADRCTFTGGVSQAFAGICTGGSGVFVASAQVRLDRCTCAGGYGKNSGGFGLAVYTPSFARISGDATSHFAGGANQVGAQNAGLLGAATGPSIEVRGPVTVLGGTSGAVALGLPRLPQLSVNGSALPSGDTDATQPVTVTLDGQQPNAPCLFALCLKPLFQPAVPPVVGELLLDIDSLVVFPGALDAAGLYQFTFVPAWAFGGGTAFPIYSQGAVGDTATGELRLSNGDARFFR